MTRTEYLFGHDASRYAELQKPLAELKIKNAWEVITSMSLFVDYSGSEVDKKATARRNEAMKAIEFWTRILEEDM
jgi:hypothetical protein